MITVLHAAILLLAPLALNMLFGRLMLPVYAVMFMVLGVWLIVPHSRLFKSRAEVLLCMASVFQGALMLALMGVRQ